MAIMSTEEIIKGLESFLDSCDELMGEYPYTEVVISEAIEKLNAMRRIEDAIRDGTF